MSGKKASTGPCPKFRFIVSDGRKGTENPEVRTLIRKQAMRDVGLARRRKSNHHVRSSVEEDSVDSSTSAHASTPSDRSLHPESETHALSDDCPSSNDGGSLDFAGSPWDQAIVVGNRALSRLSSLTPPSLHLQSAYDQTRSRFGIDISSLSALTGFNMSRSVVPLLSADPRRLVSLLELQQWSYLEYIPARYDHSPCLAAATDCVLAKTISVLSPTPYHSLTAERLYAKALGRLQDAISDPVASIEPEVLAAVKLLSLHELLDHTRGEAYSHHVIGAARLIKYRSPSRFTTDFEKALLAAHAGAIVSETIVRNASCYLDQPQWTQLLHTLCEETDDLTERSPLILNIRIKMMALPGLWRDIDDFMNSERIFDDDALQETERQCEAAHAVYMQWLDDYNAHCVRNSFRQVTREELELRRDVFGTVCECVLLIKRFWACLAEDRRLHLELEIQALAKLILGLQQVSTSKLSWLFTIHETEMAKAAISTQHVFEEDSRHLSVFERRLASRRRYKAFSQTMRVDVHDPPMAVA